MSGIHRLKIHAYEKKDGNTYYYFQTYLGLDEFGKPVRVRKSGLKSREEAEELATRLKKDFAEGKYKKDTKITFREIYKEWFDEVYKNGVTESTSAKVDQFFKNHVLGLIGDMQLTKISPKTCTSAVKRWSEDIPSHSKAIRNYCERIFDYAISLEHVGDNPIESVEVPRKRREPSKCKEYTREDAERLLKAIKDKNNDKWYVMFRMLIMTGMKKSEVLSLEWDDFNAEDKSFSVNKGLTRGYENRLYAQSKKERIVYLDDITSEVVEAWERDSKSKLVFPNNEGFYIQPTGLTTFLNKLIDQYELKPVTTNMLRKTHADMMYNAGISKKLVQQRLGITSYDYTVNNYIRVNKEVERQAINNLIKL